MTRTRVMAHRRSRKRRPRSREALVVRSLSDSRLACEAHGFFRRPEERFRLADAFLLLGGRIGIIHDAGAGLDRHAAVLHHGRAQNDASIHLAIGAEIADAAGVRTALVLL